MYERGLGPLNRPKACPCAAHGSRLLLSEWTRGIPSAVRKHRGGFCVEGAPPLIVASVDTRPEEPTRGAGFGIRLLARFIDLVFGAILGLVTGVATGILCAIMAHYGKLPENWVELTGQSSFADYFFGAVGAFLYHSFAEGISGTSMGKLTCGLRVVSRDGGRIDLEAGLKRGLWPHHWDASLFGVVAYARMENSPLRQRALWRCLG